MPPSPTRAWISYRPSITLPTNGSFTLRSRGCEPHVRRRCDLIGGEADAAEGLVGIDADDRDLATGDRAGVDAVRADDRGGPVRLDALRRADADRDQEVGALDLLLEDAADDRR